MERSRKPAPISPMMSAPQAIVSVSDDNHTVTARLPSGETVTVLLFGATVTSWTNSDGSENLWVSEKAILDGSKPVRGGIPLVFPVFGPPPPAGTHPTSSLPQHGFARNVRWEYLGKSSSESGADLGVKLDFGLYSSALPEKFKSAWPYDFGVVYSVTLTPGSLGTVVNVRNEGTETFEFKVLYHTYFRIKDIGLTKVTGLAGVSYVDKVLNASTQVQSTPEVAITGETDRVYASIPQSTTSIVVGGTPRFDIIRDNISDAVIWNPWTKAESMGDFYPKDGYQNMICVESGAVNEWTTLEAGESWEGGQIMKSLQ